MLRKYKAKKKRKRCLKFGTMKKLKTALIAENRYKGSKTTECLVFMFKNRDYVLFCTFLELSNL